jgi:hypothetical protein
MPDRLEEAQDDPESLSQETIIHNLSPEEAHRLSKVRNIGIAVGTSLQLDIRVPTDRSRRTLTLAKRRPLNECSSTRAE